MDLPVIALLTTTVLGACGLLVTVITVRQKANTDYVSTLEKRIDKLEDDIKTCQQERERLERQLTDLLAQLLRYTTHYPPPPLAPLPPPP